MSAARADLRPLWLRPATVALVLSAHIGALLLGRAAIEAPPSLESFQVELVPEGESVADQTPQAQVTPQEAKPQEQPPPETAALAPPPQPQAPEAPPVAEPAPKPSVEHKQHAEQHKRELEDRRRDERKREAQEARQQERRGATHGARQATGMSRANFAGLVVAQLNRHKFYPAAARAAGLFGSVGVAFSIGPSGRVVSQSVTRSSGHALLDNAARVILSSIQTPPPPGGRFSTSTNINFQTR